MIAVLLVWVFAALLTAVVLAFAGYELHWKSRRLRDGLAGLTDLADQLVEVQSALMRVRERAVALGADLRIR